MKIKSKVLIFIIALIVVFGTFGAIKIFSKKDNTNSENNNSNPVEQKNIEILDMNSTSRPVAVMINNIGAARQYHSGLQDAYLVYEIIVEGGITRLMALYKDADTAKIGSVRSARHYYLDYVLENDAIYVHWGFSDQANKDIKSLGINNVNGLYYGNTYFWRDNSLNVSLEHRAFTSMELINKAIDKFGYRKTLERSLLLNYSAEEIDIANMDDAIPAKDVSIRYSSSVVTTYVYDEESGNYKRSVNGEKHVDYITKEQYTAKNIITYKVNNATISGDDKGRQNLDNIGSGEGYLITNGYAVPITWEKKSRSSKTVYKYKNGEVINVNDGNTYIQIQPSGQKLSIS